MAITTTVAFIAVTCWWLTQDHSIPSYDAGWHLESAVTFHSMLMTGQLLAPFTQPSIYPPLPPLVGALAMFIGGVTIPTPIIAENIVFVPLLTLGCYQTGKLLFGRLAGMLAVFFVLGSPLLSSQFHVFLVDPPETAVVALAMWALIASDGFSRVGMSALAGLAIGCGLMVKITFPLFVAGIVLVALVRCAWRLWQSRDGARRTSVSAADPLLATLAGTGSTDATTQAARPHPIAAIASRPPRRSDYGRVLAAAAREVAAATPVLIMDVVGVALAIFTALTVKGAVKGGLAIQPNVETTLHLMRLPCLLTVLLFAYSGLYTRTRRHASRRRIVTDLVVVTAATFLFAVMTGGESFHTYYVFGASLLFGALFICILRWLNERVPGIIACGAIAIVIGTPWYLYHVSEFHMLVVLGSAQSGALPGEVPPTLSSASLLWYAWSTLNSQLGVWLFALLIAGSIATVVAIIRDEHSRWGRTALVAGLFVAWLAITLTPHKDIRYDMPLMPYLAVVGTGWIALLRRPARLAAATLVVLAVAANTLSSTFGVGAAVQVALVKHPPRNEAEPDVLTLYSYGALGVAGPRRDGDVPGLLRALYADGVRTVTWEPEQGAAPLFSKEGLDAISAIAGLAATPVVSSVTTSPTVAALVHMMPRPSADPPCSRLYDGSAVWVLRLDPVSRRLAFFCPRRDPQFVPPTGALGAEALALVRPRPSPAASRAHGATGPTDNRRRQVVARQPAAHRS